MGILTISSNVKERDLLESCLNLYHAGYNYTFQLALHSLVHSWHYKKLMYYINLIEEDSFER